MQQLILILCLLCQVTAIATASNTLTYHYDYRGSTVALTDGGGLVTDRIEYSLYGLTTYRAGTNDTPFLFNGRYGVMTDPNGLLYIRARYYNPYLCRFLSSDPSGFAGGLNQYAYCNGNPVSYLDPFRLGAVGETSGGSWLDQALEGTALGDWSKGFSQGLETWASGKDINYYTWSGSDAYMEGITSGYNAVPSAIELASLALMLPTGGASVEAEAVLGVETATARGVAETTATQLEFGFARGAMVQTPEVTTAGETFVRVGAAPKYLNFSFDGTGGALPNTYAMPEATFNAIGRDPATLKSLLDLPGQAPVYYRYLRPPPGTLIQRGIVPGGEFGGVGGKPEVLFPKGF